MQAENPAPELYPGLCVSKSWELFKANFGQVFPATLLVMAASWGASAVPYFGMFLSGAIHAVLYGGLYAYFLKLIRGQKAEIADAFSGFTVAFVQLLLGGGVISLLTIAAAGLFAAPFLVAVIPAVMLMVRNEGSAWPVFPGALAVAGLCAGIAVVFVLTTLWAFAVPLIMDRKMDFWPAMELSRKTVQSCFWKVIGLVFVSGLIVLSGVFLCGIGVFFTMPIGFGAVVYGYESLFGRKD